MSAKIKTLIIFSFVYLNLSSLLLKKFSYLTNISIGTIFFVFLLSLFAAQKRLNLLHFPLLFLILPWLSLLVQTKYFVPGLSFLLAFLISYFFLLLRKQTRVLKWFKLGSLNRNTSILTALTGLTSTAALILWALWLADPSLFQALKSSVSTLPRALTICLIIPLFALWNAFCEEVVYRGVAQEFLSDIFSNKLTILILQSTIFAAVHFQAGFPNGFLGYLMVFFYGLMLGHLRQKTQGLLAPYAAHVLSDLTIGYSILFFF